MARYSAAEALRQLILLEETASDDDSVVEGDVISDNGHYLPAKVKKTQGRCHMCPRDFDKKTRKFCNKCSSPSGGFRYSDRGGQINPDIRLYM